MFSVGYIPPYVEHSTKSRRKNKQSDNTVRPNFTTDNPQGCGCFFHQLVDRTEQRENYNENIRTLSSRLRFEQPVKIQEHNVVQSHTILGFKSKFRYRMEPTFKCLVVGDVGVGKTSFVQRYAYQRKVREYKATLGVDFALKIVKWSEHVNIKLQLWDIAGQERFGSMTRVYYKDAHACIIMFDLTRRDTFLNALKWKRDLDSKCFLPDGSPLPCVLLANKCDMSDRQVETAELERFCKNNDFIGYDKISVKEGRMVEEAMSFLLNDMMRRYGDIDEADKMTETDGVTIRLDRQHSADYEQSKDCNC